MDQSIMPFDLKGRCYICGANCHTDVHHIFQGSNRKVSDEYGLTVNLCRICHERAHRSPEEFEEAYHLKKRAQTAAMIKYRWNIEQWREVFSKDYRNFDHWEDYL